MRRKLDTYIPSKKIIDYLEKKSYGWLKGFAKYCTSSKSNDSHPTVTLAHNPISRSMQIVEQQPPLTLQIFHPMSFWAPGLPLLHDHIYRNKLN